MANDYPNLTNAAIRIAVGAVIFLVIAGLASSCMTTSIDSGHQGVKFNPLGGGTNLEDIYGEGLQVFLPWERMIEYDVRVKSASEEIEALSSNGASIGMEITIRYRPDREELPELHQTYGQNYYEQLVQPEIRSAAREIVGQYTPEDLYSAQRTSLQQQIMGPARGRRRGPVRPDRRRAHPGRPASRTRCGRPSRKSCARSSACSRRPSR